MRSVDTVYEYSGLKLAGMIQEILGELGIPLIVALAGMAWTIHRVCERGSPRDLALYLCYLILAVWLLSPTETGSVHAPRLIVILGEASDIVQERAAGRINDRFLKEPFEWERIAAMVSLARILDPDLARNTGSFLEACAKPAIARAAPSGPNVFRPGTVIYDSRCERERDRIWKSIQMHVRTHPFHKAAIDAGAKHDPKKVAPFRERYLDEIATKALRDPWSPTGETSLVRASLGRYSYTDPSQSVGYSTGLQDGMSVGSAGWLANAVIEDALNVIVSTSSTFQQAWSNRFAAKQRYYLVITYGPHVYGLCLMILTGLFPIAALFALLPAKWGVFVNFGKVFLSVKLWPVGWAALSAFNARRGSLAVFDPAERGTVDIFLAVATMYALVPALSFLVVHLATSAMAAPFSQAAPPAAGPGLGPAGPAVNLAVRAAR